MNIIFPTYLAIIFKFKIFTYPQNRTNLHLYFLLFFKKIIVWTGSTIIPILISIHLEIQKQLISSFLPIFIDKRIYYIDHWCRYTYKKKEKYQIMRDQSSLRGIISYRERKLVSLCYCFWLDLTTEFIRDACYMQMDGAKLRAFNRDPTGLTIYRIRHWNHFLVILERIIVGLYPRSWIHATISFFYSYFLSFFRHHLNMKKWIECLICIIMFLRLELVEQVKSCTLLTCAFW